MFTHAMFTRIGGRPLTGPLLMTLLAATTGGCDPGALKDFIDDHGGQSVPPSSGSADGGSGPTSPCAATLCEVGSHCEVQQVQCVRAPCPPVATCVKNPPTATTFCGGIAGIPCAGSGQCVDDPSDSCDPKAGGADCGGICQCVQNVACVKGATFDSSPRVCACVPTTTPPPPPDTCGPVCDIFCEFGNVLDAKGCPTCRCNPAPTTDPCATVRCAAGTHCEATPVQCIKAPCPAQAACVPDAPVIHCGGFAGIPCPGAGKCADDPSDSCDPNAGGADCGGICQCVQTVLCVRGATFDNSPKVCACVTPSPPPPVCGPVCQIFCQFGNVLDAKGCPTCQCNKPPTPPVACPVEKCTGPGPKSVTTLCPDGKTTAGPACVVSATGVCEWTVTTCPAVDVK